MKIIGYSTLLPFLLIIIGVLFLNFQLVLLGFSLICVAVPIAFADILVGIQEFKQGIKPPWNIAVSSLALIISILTGLFFFTAQPLSM